LTTVGVSTKTNGVMFNTVKRKGTCSYVHGDDRVIAHIFLVLWYKVSF